MGGSNSGISKKRTELRRKFSPDPTKGLDNRAKDPRAFRERCAQLVADQAGHDAVSAVMHSTIQRTAFIEARVIAIEADALDGKAVDPVQYINFVNTLLRLFDRLGYQRRSKPLPRALEYAAQVAAQSPEGGAA